MRPLKVAFLWHMHQPLYQEAVNGRFLLPWVRLHALKGYIDMPSVISKYPKAKASFNLTPSLLLQLEECFKEDIRERDEFLRVTLKPAAALEPFEKEFILANFFMNNWDRIVKPHPRYSELLNLRGAVYKPQELSQIAKRFEVQDYLDLQVLFNLGWFGFTLKKKEKKIQELLTKQRFYTEDDKIAVIALQFAAMREVMPLYKKLQASGQIELTTTPFYHPILPLLYNGGSGEGYNWREDADIQLSRGLEFFEKRFGMRPKGVWPSEGSVSEPVAKLASELGVEWLGTDEEILMQSLSDPAKREAVIYAPYLFRKDGREITIFFRDKKLSDLIGFSYAKSEPEPAVHDFVNRLKHIHNLTAEQGDDPVVSIILDGENAWEYYDKDGEAFLNLLYEQISNDPAFEMVRFCDVIEKSKPRRTLEKLYAGSWINRNFQIWFGHDEDKRAWECLAKTRNFLINENLPPEKKALAWEELYIAEGSDWFWWYGDEFSSSTQEMFDFLFRNHLMNVYRAADKRIPGYLLQSIKQFGVRSQLIEHPTSLISPTIDGKITGFYEWMGAGRFYAAEPQGAMQKSEKWIRDIFFASDHDNLYLRVDFDPELIKENLSELSCCIYMASLNEFELQIELKSNEIMLFQLTPNDKLEIPTVQRWVAFKKILEIAIPFNEINTPVRNNVEVKVALLKNRIVVEEAPRLGLIQIARPDETLEKSMWSL